MGNARNITISVEEFSGGAAPPRDLETQHSGERARLVGRARRWFTRPVPPGPSLPEDPNAAALGPCLW